MASRGNSSDDIYVESPFLSTREQLLIVLSQKQKTVVSAADFFRLFYFLSREI